MKTKFCLRLLASLAPLASLALLALFGQLARAEDFPHPRSHPSPAAAATIAETTPPLAELSLPPLPEGVVQLGFSEIFKLPFGKYGPEFTDKARSLEGKKVRILGYMVKEDTSRDTCNPGAPLNRPSWMSSVLPGRLMLTPNPAATSMAHYALCDDLPVHTLFVTVPDRFAEQVPYARGPLLLTGLFSIGNQNEPDGRVSAVRLLLDSASAEKTERNTPLSMSSGHLETRKPQP